MNGRVLAATTTHSRNLAGNAERKEGKLGDQESPARRNNMAMSGTKSATAPRSITRRRRKAAVHFYRRSYPPTTGCAIRIPCPDPIQLALAVREFQTSVSPTPSVADR